jgi:hypothetical protein
MARPNTTFEVLTAGVAILYVGTLAQVARNGQFNVWTPFIALVFFGVIWFVLVATFGK